MCNVVMGLEGRRCHFKKYLGRKLPTDASGLCIFHSLDIDWKIKNNFSAWFIKLFNKLANDSSKEVYDFKKIVFVPKEGEHRENVFGEKLIDFRKFIFDKETFFNECTFVGFANFTKSEFRREAYFERATFKSVDFADSTFDRFYFKESQVEGYADFQKCTFNEHVYFNGCVFKKRVYFNKATFCSHASFKHTHFHRQTNFEDVKYPDDWTIDYSFMLIKPECTLHFKGLNFQNRLFENTTKGKVHFELIERDVEGKILFEAVDMHKIKHLDVLLELARKEKIDIGVSCGTSYKFYVRNIDDHVKLNVYKVFLECFNRFISNEYNLLFNISFKEVQDGYQIEFHSKEYIPRERFIDIAYKFKQEFNEILLSQLRKNRPLKALLQVSDRLIIPSAREKISKLTEADLEIDIANILLKVKKYHEMGFFKRLGRNINLNILSIPINLNKFD